MQNCSQLYVHKKLLGLGHRLLIADDDDVIAVLVDAVAPVIAIRKNNPEPFVSFFLKFSFFLLR